MWPFKKKVKKEVIIPEPGETWTFKDDDSPWPRDITTVTILDTKDGWVRYSINGSIFNDERHTLDTFLYMYRK